MQDHPPTSAGSASDRWAALLRDCLLGLVLLGMIGWLVYFGITAIRSGHLDLSHGGRPSRRWFLKPLDGLPARLAGFSFISLAATFLSLGMTHPGIGSRIPSWMRYGYWWFFAGWALLFVAAHLVS